MQEQAAAGAEAAGPLQAPTSTSQPPPHIVRRSRSELRAAVTCPLCGDILRDPHLSTACMHTACYACFEKHWEWDGKANQCPLCEAEGVSTLWGAYPTAGSARGPPKLQRDLTLLSLLRKLFPRRDVDEEVAQRQAVEVLRVADGRRQREPAGPAVPSYDECVPFVALRVTAGGAAAAELSRPYLVAPWAATVAAVAGHLGDRIRVEQARGDGAGCGAELQPSLFCNGRALHPDDTLLAVYHLHWLPAAGASELMQLHYIRT